MTDTTTPPAFIRFEKLRSWNAIHRSGGHNWRTDPVPHADPERTHLNEDWRPVSDPVALAAAIRERLALVTKAPALDAVLCLEFLVTARREAFTEHGGETNAAAYFRDALAFLERRHGAENVVAVNWQRDEHAPHLVAYVVPLVERPGRTVRRNVFAPGRDAEGRQRREVREFPAPPEVALSASHYYPTPDHTTALQDEFAAEVAARHGLARGLEMSAARHTPNAKYQAAMAQAMASHIGLTAEELERRGPIWKRESPEEQAARLSELIREHYAETVATAATAAHDRRRARAMVETARRHRARYHAERDAHATTRAKLERLEGGLAPEQRQALERQAAEYRRANRQAEGERRLAEKCRELTAKGEAAERQAREERQHAEEKAAAQREERQADDRLAAQLRDMTPETFAKMPEPLRLRCWRLLRLRDDLEPAFERVDASGLVDMVGRLTPKGRALVSPDPAPEEPRQATPASHAAEVTDLWDRIARGPGL
ncbi:plasmid recombination protein [Modicisalibacter tunisiensis]|uniref:MobV family relaxase n=1 Tax=Modicisalibacter tunisiensis TaxID=390637 RepID=UPI001CCEF8AC|nr:MobV family relaxase [Modicisalibacter tunisiensis]MBZ9540494.1 plasmid recombination protein [Modicisalibacter tunisiensis]